MGITNLQTAYLKLTKPWNGTYNWGEIVNKNWDTLDRAYQKLNNSLNSIHNKIDEVGSFSFIEYQQNDGGIAVVDTVILSDCYVCIDVDGEEQWCKVHYNTTDKKYVLDGNYTTDAEAVLSYNKTKCLFGTQDANLNFLPDGEQYSGFYVLSGVSDGTDHLLDTIPDHSLFYIHFPVLVANQQNLEYSAIRCFNYEWRLGDILVKTTVRQDNAEVTRIVKLKQSIGGYYTPSSNANTPNKITYTKTTAAQAVEKVDVFYARNLANSVETITQLDIDASSDDTSMIIDTQVPETSVIGSSGNTATIHTSIGHIHFFKGTETAREIIYIPYKVQLSGDRKWQIEINCQYFSGECYLSYIVLDQSESVEAMLNEG